MYLITGGAGFIGSNLVAALCRRGAEVVVADRLGAEGKWRNLARHPIAGIMPPEELDRFLASEPPLTAVLHMGAVSDTTRLSTALGEPADSSTRGRKFPARSMVFSILFPSPPVPPVLFIWSLLVECGSD